MAAHQRLLADFLRDVAGRRWEWGTTDCFMVAADWVKAKRGVDPARDFRGAYRTDAEWRALVKPLGGLRAVAARECSRIGLAKTKTPVAGDVALVLAPFARSGSRVLRRATAAICVSPQSVAILTVDQSLFISTHADLPLVAAWKV